MRVADVGVREVGGRGAVAKGESAGVNCGGGADVEEEDGTRDAKAVGARLRRFAPRPAAVLRFVREAVQHGASKAG